MNILPSQRTGLVQSCLDDIERANRVVPYQRTGQDETTLIASDLGTDVDASLRFANTHAPLLRYCFGIDWLYWDGRRWADKGKNRAIQLSMQSARQWTKKAMDTNGEERAKRINAALILESARHVEATVRLAKCHPLLVVPTAFLDSHPWKLNVLNGTIDLRTGKLQPHNRDDFLTKLAPVTYDPTARSKTLNHYLETCETATKGMSDFLARCFGAALTGEASTETLFLLQGDGGSGKTTLIEAFSAMLGDYAVKLPFESFCMSSHGRNPGAASPDLLKLRGSRLAYASEGDPSSRLDAGMVKMLTGNEPITARGLYSDPITFHQSWKLWLVSNFDPKVDSEDTGIWRRMLKLHFATIPEDRRDPAIKRILTDDPHARSALLHWVIAGCIDWQARGGGRNGLEPPESVCAATGAYQVKQDTLAQWWEDLISSNAELVALEKASVGELRRHYEAWCAENGARPVYAKRFSSHLETKGLESKRGTGGTRYWYGIKMTP